MHKKFVNIILFFVLISNIGVSQYFEKPFSNYYLNSLRQFVFALTKLNWDYGFFSSNEFGYISSEIVLMNSNDTNFKIKLSHTDLVSKYNYIRITSLLPSCMTDNLNKEASTKSIALFLFNKYEKCNRVHIEIYNNNYSVTSIEKHFELNVDKQKIYDQSLYY